MKENGGFGARFLTPLSFSSLLHGTDDDDWECEAFFIRFETRPTLGLILE